MQALFECPVHYQKAELLGQQGDHPDRLLANKKGFAEWMDGQVLLPAQVAKQAFEHFELRAGEIIIVALLIQEVVGKLAVELFPVSPLAGKELGVVVDAGS